MQRKNRFLKQRRGYAMMMTIIFMVLIGTIMIGMLSTTTETAKKTVDVYVREQAILMAKSATEYAVLVVSGHDRSGGTCVNSVTAEYPATNPIFDITVDIQYFGFGALGGCSSYVGAIQTPESNGTMLMDVYVKSKPSLHLNEPIRYHRRTLQKL